MTCGETGLLKADITYKDQSKTTPVIFDSSNTMVVRVNPLTGQLHAMDQGTAVITAICGKKKALCKVKVSYNREPPKGLDKTILNLKPGDSDYLSLGEWYLTGDEKLSWKSDNKKVAEVKNGVVTARSEGSTRITATWKKKKEVMTYTCEVTVSGAGTTVSDPSAIPKEKIAENIYDTIIYSKSYDNTGTDPVLVLKKGSVDAVYFKALPFALPDMAKAKWKAKGGAIKVKNGVITAKKPSKEDKDGNMVPSLAVFSNGKETIEIKVYVTE